MRVSVGVRVTVGARVSVGVRVRVNVGVMFTSRVKVMVRVRVRVMTRVKYGRVRSRMRCTVKVELGARIKGMATPTRGLHFTLQVADSLGGLGTDEG